LNSFVQLVFTNYREFVRDRQALFWTVAFPVLFVGIFGVVLGRGDEGVSYDIGLVVEDDSQQALQLAAILSEFDAFEITSGSAAEELAQLQEGERSAVVRVPRGFGAAINAGTSQPLQIHYDASQQTTQQVVIPVLLRALDVADRAITQTRPVVTTEFRTLQTEKLRPVDWVMPGLIAMSVMNAGVFGAIQMVSLRERRVLRRLSATPLSVWILVGADVLVKVIIVLAQTFILIVMAVLVAQVKIKPENLPALAGVVVLGGLAFLAIGFFLGAFAKTEQGFFPIAQVVTFPMLFLSGVFFPLDGMPDWIRPLISALPLTYLTDAVRQLMVGGAPTNHMIVNLGVLAVFLVGFFALAVRFFKYE
jgi:ABC-2 type transport system permease protein